MGWAELAGWVGLGRVGSKVCSFRWVGSGWVEYDKSNIFLMITKHAIAYQSSCSAVVEKFTYRLFAQCNRN